VGGYGLDLSSSIYEPVEDSSVHDNEPSVSIKVGEFLN
jgi:hypothetical protein